MRFVHRIGPGQIGLNYMWLPTFVGMNEALIREIDQAVAAQIVGKDLTEATLDEAHEKVVEFLQEKFKVIPGLYDYLDGIKYVTET